ncbi:MAG: TIGR04282 family arsenosugar biosynthesis glycosyltransferase [Acidobacteriota bacterium]|nr:TIGR04282 family arsenosugar biosynthesis glycosyltransferase [Acidobacteriota bacterium]
MGEPSRHPPPAHPRAVTDRPTAAVVVMAKAPRPGHVKTRLAPLLGHDGCARLAAALLQHSVSVAVASGLEVTVAFDPPDGRAEIAALLPAGVGLEAQAPGDLGQRMAAAAARPLGQGHPVVLIGTDAPTLTSASLLAAARELRRVDAVFGPAADGGYYLLGLSRPAPGLFALGSRWGGPEVLDASLVAARRAGLSVSRLETRRDLDTPDDAAALAADERVPAGLRRLLGVGA